MRGVKITDVTPDWMFGEETEMDESLSLQATMALSDAGIKSKWKKGKLYVAKKDIKKAEKALSKSFKKGGHGGARVWREHHARPPRCRPGPEQGRARARG